MSFEAFISRILESLYYHARKIISIIDQYETSPPEGWARWCNNQIEEADFVLVVCTGIYEARFKGIDSTGKGKGVKREGATNYNPNNEEGYESLYRHLTNQPLIEKPVLGKLKSMPPRSRKQEFRSQPWNVPFQRNQYFTGREDILKELRSALISDQAAALAQAISGLGGIGKTQTAVEYAYQYRNEYDVVLWVKADSRDALISDYAALAHVLDLPEKDAKLHSYR